MEFLSSADFWKTDALFTPRCFELFLASIILQFLHVLAYIVRLYFHIGSVSNGSLAKHFSVPNEQTCLASLLVTFEGRFVAASVLSRPHCPPRAATHEIVPIQFSVELSATIFRVTELLPRMTWPELL